MKQIRRNVFETNSSSTHSLCITKNTLLDDLRTHVDFKLMDFGWEFEVYNDVDSKAAYLYTALCNNEEHDLILMIADTLTKHGISYTFENPEDTRYGGYKAYIDHYNELEEQFNKLCSDENMLLRFLFSSESFILTGNDNEEGNVNISVSYPYDEIYKGN